MAGQQVRGRYPLTAIWTLANWRGDQRTRIRILAVTAKIAAGRLTFPELACADAEAWLERYANGVVD